MKLPECDLTALMTTLSADFPFSLLSNLPRSLVNEHLISAFEMHSFSFYYLQLLYLLHSKTKALCYFPNGQVTDDLECFPSQPETPCCVRGSTCLSNGLCQSTNSSGGVNYGRRSCTDPSWRSTLCPQHCQSGDAA